MSTAAVIGHFTVTGEFVTMQARSFWFDEGRPDRAWKLLQCVLGLTCDQAMDILCGRAKLTGDTESGVGFEPDDAILSPSGNPLPSNCFMDAIYKLMDERDSERQLAQDLMDMYTDNTAHLPSPTGLRKVPQNRCKVRQGCAGSRLVLKDGLDFEDLPVWKQLPRFPTPSIYPLAKRDRAPELPEPPRYRIPDAQDLVTTNNGWLSPEGKFYPCLYMEHISLAIALESTEGRIEKLGWIKITAGQWMDSLTGHRATNAQRNLIFDWCVAHGEKMPYWLLEEE